MPIFDFKCTNCGTVEEKLIPVYEETGTCPTCGGDTRPGIGCVNIKLNGCDPSFPSAYESWPKKREQKMKQERKQQEG